MKIFTSILVLLFLITSGLHAQKTIYITYTKFDALRFTPDFTKTDNENCIKKWDCADALNKPDPEEIIIKVDTCSGFEVRIKDKNVWSLQQARDYFTAKKSLLKANKYFLVTAVLTGRWQAFKINSITR